MLRAHILCKEVAMPFGALLIVVRVMGDLRAYACRERRVRAGDAGGDAA
jgi:hypothetical protein